MRLVAALLAFLVIAAACGSSGSTQSGSDGSSSGGCPSGQVLCSACSGGGFCGAACPNIRCPLLDAGGALDATGADGGACPADASTSCTDCGGQLFCVSGPCPTISCPGADAAAPQCAASPPPVGQACGAPLACPYGSTCAFCAPTNPGIGSFDCAAKPCTWGAMSLQPNAGACPTSPPQNHDPCGAPNHCDYCTPGGLVAADCSSIADTYTWSTGFVANMITD